MIIQEKTALKPEREFKQVIKEYADAFEKYQELRQEEIKIQADLNVARNEVVLLREELRTLEQNIMSTIKPGVPGMPRVPEGPGGAGGEINYIPAGGGAKTFS